MKKVIDLKFILCYQQEESKSSVLEIIVVAWATTTSLLACKTSAFQTAMRVLEIVVVSGASSWLMMM